MSAAARTIWLLAEPLHALTYFAPESPLAYEEAGVRGFWRGCFAGRAAPLGRTPAGVVTATFFGFRSDFVARAIPSVWELIDPSDAVAARLDGVDRALRRICGTALPTTGARHAADAVRAAVEAAPAAGRPLFSANRELAWPAAPHLAIWHAATLLREHRGDGHVSTLVAAGLDPCEAHVLRIADDGAPLDSIQPHRGWTETDWSAAEERLETRGWIRERRTTATGAAARAAIEADTDRLSGALVDAIEDLSVVTDALGDVSARLQETAAIPYPNPMGPPARGQAGLSGSVIGSLETHSQGRRSVRWWL